MPIVCLQRNGISLDFSFPRIVMHKKCAISALRSAFGRDETKSFEPAGPRLTSFADFLTERRRIVLTRNLTIEEWCLQALINAI